MEENLFTCNFKWWLTLNSGHILIKINRISAWALLIIMVVFLVSGYALGRSYHNAGSGGQVLTHAAGHVSGVPLPGARFDKHQIHSDAVASGAGQIVNTILVVVGAISLWMVYNVSIH